MKKVGYLTTVVLFVSGVSALLFWAASYKKVLPVETTRARMANFQSSVSTNGKIEAEKIYEIHAPYSGVVRDVRVRMGQQLAANQPILDVVDASLEADLVAARAELAAAQVDLQNTRRGATKEEVDQANAEVARLKMEAENARKTMETNEWLFKRDAISRYELDQSSRALETARLALAAAETRRNDLNARYTPADLERANARVEAATAKLRLLEANKSRSVVRAPAAGTLYHFEIKDGTVVNGGDLLGLLADLEHLRARAYVDEPDLGQVALGEQVVIHWDARSDETWRGKVQFIPSEVVTHGTRSVAEVLCSIDSPAADLIPNVNVDINILSAEGAKVLTIPRSALITEGNNFSVWTIRDSEAVSRRVEVGRSTSAQVEITRGLTAGEEVIVPGDSPISEGAKVRVVTK